jgi:hypothetical protein
MSLKMIKIYGNMLEYDKIVCKKYDFNISAFIGSNVWITSELGKPL